ncbi:hypothetical protein WJ966_00575 [Achromobacter xylosoxidans]
MHRDRRRGQDFAAAAAAFVARQQLAVAVIAVQQAGVVGGAEGIGVEPGEVPDRAAQAQVGQAGPVGQARDRKTIVRRRGVDHGGGFVEVERGGFAGAPGRVGIIDPYPQQRIRGRRGAVVVLVPGFIPWTDPGFELPGIVQVAATDHFRDMQAGTAAAAVGPVPDDEVAFEQIAAIVAARADRNRGPGGMEGDVVDRQAQRVEGGERRGLAAAVQADAVAQGGAAIDGARARIDQQRKGRGHRRELAVGTEEHGGDLAGAAQRRIHERVHDGRGPRASMRGAAGRLGPRMPAPGRRQGGTMAGAGMADADGVKGVSHQGGASRQGRVTIWPRRPWPRVSWREAWPWWTACPRGARRIPVCSVRPAGCFPGGVWGTPRVWFSDPLLVLLAQAEQ